MFRSLNCLVLQVFSCTRISEKYQNIRKMSNLIFFKFTFGCCSYQRRFKIRSLSVADEGTDKQTNQTFSSNDGAAQLD